MSIYGEQDPFLVPGSYSRSNCWKVTVYVEGSGHLKEPTTPTAIMLEDWKVTVYVEGSGRLREPTTPTAIAAAPEREDGTGPRRDIWWYGRGQ